MILAIVDFPPTKMIEVIRSESMEFIPVGWYIAIYFNEYFMFFNKPLKKKINISKKL